MELSNIIKKDSNEQRAWYVVPGFEDVEKPPRVLIYKPLPKEVDQVRKKSKRRRFGGRRSEEIYDEQKLMDGLLELMVEDWENIVEDGNKVEVTTANKKILDGSWQEFRDLWQLVYNDVEAAEELRIEDERKN